MGLNSELIFLSALYYVHVVYTCKKNDNILYVSWVLIIYDPWLRMITWRFILVAWSDILIPAPLFKLGME